MEVLDNDQAAHQSYKRCSFSAGSNTFVSSVLLGCAAAGAAEAVAPARVQGGESMSCAMGAWMNSYSTWKSFCS